MVSLGIIWSFTLITSSWVSREQNVGSFNVLCGDFPVVLLEILTELSLLVNLLSYCWCAGARLTKTLGISEGEIYFSIMSVISFQKMKSIFAML